MRASARATLILIEGPAGAGKTELVRAARAAGTAHGPARAQSCSTRAARSSSTRSRSASCASCLSRCCRCRGRRERCCPAPRRRRHACSSADEPSPAGAEPGFEALHGLYWLVVNLADTAPVLMLVDDCHWADPESLRFLHYLAQRLEGLPVAMLLAGRPPEPAGEDGGALWALVRSRPDAVALFPQPLSEDAAAELTRARLGEEAAPAFCRACPRRHRRQSAVPARAAARARGGRDRAVRRAAERRAVGRPRRRQPVRACIAWRR